MKKAMILAVAASAAMLSACHTSGKVDNFTINVDAVSSATTAVDVPYKVWHLKSPTSLSAHRQST